jgi:signal transduction histidine kinase
MAVARPVDVRRSALQTRLLFDLVRNLDSDLSRSLRHVVEAAARGLCVRRVSVWFWDPGRTAIVCRACSEPTDLCAEGTRLSAEDHPSYFDVLSLERTIAVHDVRTDPRTRELQAYAAQHGITSMLDVPVWREGEVVAVICHEHVGEPRRWTAGERRFAASLADLVAMALEIADRTHVEVEHDRLLERLEAQRSHLDQVLRQLPVGVLIVEAPSGRPVFANVAAERLWQKPFDPDEVIDAFRLGDVLRADGTPYAAGELPLARALRTGQQIEDEDLWIRRADRSLALVSTRAAPLRDLSGVVVGAVATWVDVTEPRRATRALEEESRLRDRFVAVLGHDLRGPLTTVLVSAELLYRAVDEAGRPHTERILTSARRMKRMVGDLLDLTRSRAGLALPLQRTPCDLDTICREVLEEVRPLFPERPLALRVEGRPEGVWDAGRLGQALSNLVLNALRYGDPEEPVEVRLVAHSDDVEVEVHNGGIPADPHRVTRILEGCDEEIGLEPGPLGDGLGLGLRIVREIVLAHGGRVTMSASERRGTTFALSLPRRPREGERPPTPARRVRDRWQAGVAGRAVRALRGARARRPRRAGGPRRRPRSSCPSRRGAARGRRPRRGCAGRAGGGAARAAVGG